MPLIMEGDINVDDLFGESTSLELGLPTNSTTTKGLAQRLDEMRLTGCCQKIAWSRFGCIAYISQDLTRVNVRHLQCQPSDGKWVLSDETPLPQVTEAHGGHTLVHLCWNEYGSDLAVADSSGRVSIYSIPLALNAVNGLRQAAFDADDDGAQIVGMMWLNQQRSVHSFYQAAKVQGRWAYSPFRRRPIGPFHPANKAALLCITRSGVMKLLYQNPDGRWAEITAELKNTNYSDRLLTHAALVATQAGILIATHSACRKISLYRVNIQWNPPQWDPAQQKQGPQQPPVPSFRFVHSKVEVPYNIPSTNRGGGDNPDEQPPLTNSLYCLTSLQIILPASDNSAGSAPNPWVVAVFCIPPHAILPHHSQLQVPSSVIVRWQLESGALSLHPKFDEVASKKSSVQIKPRTVLRRLDDITSDRHVISVDQIEYANVLAITYDDSSIIFYDPKSMAVFNGVDDTNIVTSLAQGGFHYPLDSSGLHISFSPSACLAVVLDSDGQTHLRVMEHSYGAESGLYDENKFSAAVAALTLAFCRGCGGDVNTDDILLILIRQLSPDAQTAFVNEVYRALSINCNFTTEQDKLMNHPYISRALSIQAALGFKNKYKGRDFSSAVPWAVLHLRQAAILYPFFFQYNKGVQAAEPHDPDVLRMVLGNTKWALDFSLYILNELFDLADEFEGVSSDQEAFNQKVKSTVSLPLIVLLSSMSRAFLRFICRGLRGIHAGYASAPLTGDARVYYTEICHTLDASPIRIDAYEKFLAGVDSAVKHAYTGAGFGDNERPGPEKELLVNSRIPPVLVTAVSTILRQTVPALRPEVDRMAVYMGDYSWLGLSADARAEAYRRSRDVDVLKKIPLPPKHGGGGGGGTSSAAEVNHPTKNGNGNQGHLRRRCVRCCEVSDGVYPPRTVLGFRMILKLGHLRACSCGGMWTLEQGSSP